MTRFVRRFLGPATLTAILLIAPGRSAPAQEEAPVFPFGNFVLTGYGTANYIAEFDGDAFKHDFTALFVPIFLYQIGTDLLFEGELEFELEEDGVETGVEYAQIDYLGWSHVILTGGKFLLPFGVFSDRYHPAWINELPSFPLLYGHGHAEFEPLLPVLADIGALLRVAAPVGERWGFDLSLYVTQGPRIELEEAEENGDEPSHTRAPFAEAPNQTAPLETLRHLVPKIAIGETFEDTNDNKLVGARIGFVHAPGFEVYLSGFYSRYDPGDVLNWIGLNLAPELRYDRFELRGEGVLLWQEIFLEDGHEEMVKFPGYYAQASVRLGRFEPVARWSHLLETELDAVTVRDAVQQLALGLDYWIYPSVPVKLAYEANFGVADRLLAQWAYGF